MYIPDLALDNLQGLICHKKPSNQLHNGVNVIFIFNFPAIFRKCTSMHVFDKCKAGLMVIKPFLNSISWANVYLCFCLFVVFFSVNLYHHHHHHHHVVPIFVAASHQTRLDTRSKARRPIKVGIKGRGRSGRSRDSNPACLCCSSAHLVQCEPDEASSFTNPNVGPGTYASLRLKLDAWSSAVQGGQRRQECSSPTRR